MACSVQFYWPFPLLHCTLLRLSPVHDLERRKLSTRKREKKCEKRERERRERKSAEASRKVFMNTTRVLKQGGERRCLLRVLPEELSSSRPCCCSLNTCSARRRRRGRERRTGGSLISGRPTRLGTRMSSSSSSSDPGRRNGGRSRRSIALRRTLYSPAVIAFSCCLLKVVAFGFKPFGILMTCTMLGFTVPFGPHTLWDTIPVCIIIGLLLYFTSKMELDGFTQAIIATGGLAAVFFSWKMQGPVPSLPRRVPKYIQSKLEAAYEREAFKEKALDGERMAATTMSSRPKAS